MKKLLLILSAFPVMASAQSWPYVAQPAPFIGQQYAPQPYVAVVPQYRDNLQQQGDLRLQQELTNNLRLQNEQLKNQLGIGTGLYGIPANPVPQPVGRQPAQVGGFEIIE